MPGRVKSKQEVRCFFNRRKRVFPASAPDTPGAVPQTYRLAHHPQASRAPRAERRLQALVSQRPAFWKDTVAFCASLIPARCRRLLNPALQTPLALAFSVCTFPHCQCFVWLLAVGFARRGETRTSGLVTRLHKVALQAMRPYVVVVTPSATPPRWFLVMEVSALPCHCPQLPFSRVLLNMDAPVCSS